MGQPDGLAERLAVCVDEDEREGRRQLTYLERHGTRVPDWEPTLAAIAERTLAEVVAKRAILDEVSTWRHLAVGDGYYSCSQATEENGYPLDMACADEERVGQPCDCGMEKRRKAVLGHLASVYADREGWREEWRPQ